MIQELLDQIEAVKVQVTALKARITDLLEEPAPAPVSYQEAEADADGSNKITVIIPSDATIIGVTLRCFDFHWASRQITIVNISKKVIGSDLYINLFLSQNAPDKSYRGRVAYYTTTP